MKKFIFIFTISSIFLISFANPIYADCAPGPSGICATSTTPAKITDLGHLISNIVNVLYALVELVFFVMLLVQGYKYLVSAGDQKKTGEVKSGLTYTIIGFVLVNVSYLIIVLIGNVVGFQNGFGFLGSHNKTIQVVLPTDTQCLINGAIGYKDSNNVCKPIN